MPVLGPCFALAGPDKRYLVLNGILIMKIVFMQKQWDLNRNFRCLSRGHILTQSLKIIHNIPIKISKHHSNQFFFAIFQFWPLRRNLILIKFETDWTGCKYSWIFPNRIRIRLLQPNTNTVIDSQSNINYLPNSIWSNQKRWLILNIISN